MPLSMLSSSLDWDKVRIFYTAAEAGSFTHAGDSLGLSQSAVSRQVGALERDLAVPLFHRHARGLILTEQGELLFRTAKEMMLKLEAHARAAHRQPRASQWRVARHHHAAASAPTG